MPHSSKALLAESCATALTVFTFAHPIGAGCSFVLSSVLSSLVQTEPSGKLVELLGEELARAVGIWFSEKATEVEPGSLPEAILLALRHALGRIRAEHRETVRENDWDDWFRNWEAACKSVRDHRWKDLRGLTLAVGRLNEQPGDWAFLKETLVLLDWSARLAGSSSANRVEMPQGLESLLEAQLGGEFIEQIKTLLASGKFDRAHVELTVEIASVASIASTLASQPAPISRRLTGPDDARLIPMRGFFAGRETQVQAVVDFLRGEEKLGVVTGRVYNVQGGPGVGKTELCKAALREYLRDHGECRAYYIDVTGVRSADGLRVALADALGNQRLAEDPPSLLHELRSRTDLIYLDNLEDALPVQGGAAEEVFGWLEEMVRHEIKTLASSRRRLGSIAREFPLSRLSAPEAERVFRHFWVQAGGGPIGEDGGFRRFIEHDLDCHALTIRLLALQAGEWGSWQNLRSQWLTARTRLAQDAGRSDRFSSLDVSISLTFEQIGSTAAELWIAFACFPDGMSAAARRAIVPEEAGLEEALGVLNRHGVIDRPAGGWREARVEMLAPLRQFTVGLSRSVALPVWERCLVFFAGVAEWVQSTERGGGEQRSVVLDALSAEFGNLQECMLLAVEQGVSTRLVERVHGALLNSYQFHAIASRGLLGRLDGFFRAQRREQARANTLRSLGDLESRLGNVDGARQRYEEALKLYESEQSNLGRANTLKSLGDLESRLGNVDGARQRYEDALKLFESEREPQGIALTSLGLAVIRHVSGESPAARVAAERARTAARATNNPAVVEHVEGVLGEFGLLSSAAQQ